jgi:tRNA(fMet)-specific endonuclease VapC
VTWLLDTCVLSDVARGEPGSLARLKATPPSAIAVSAITVMEVEYGLAKAPSRVARLGPLMRALLGAVTVIPFDAGDARACASLRASLEEKGRPIGAYDILIAGSALARGLVLVTSNVGEFGRVSGLRVENWRAHSAAPRR